MAKRRKAKRKSSVKAHKRVVKRRSKSARMRKGSSTKTVRVKKHRRKR